MAFPYTKSFNKERYLCCPLFSVQQGVAVARELCACFPKVAPALVKRAKDNLKRVAEEAQAAIDARSRQGLLSEAESKLLDDEMNRSWTAMLMRLEANTMLPHEEYAIAGRSEELIIQLFYEDSSDFMRDTYGEQLVAMQRMLQRIEQDKLEAEFNELCGNPFLAVFRRILPRYEKLVNSLPGREAQGEPLVNLLVHRNALGRAVLTYSTAISLTVNDYDFDTVKQAWAALEPLERQAMVKAGRGRQATSSPELTPPWSAAEAPLPA